MCRVLPVWTYGMKDQPGVYLGPIIVAQKDRPVIVKWFNQLPNDPNILPFQGRKVDHW